MKQLKKQVIAFLTQREQMLKDGFPYCLNENGIPFHCDTCIEAWEKLQEYHKKHKKLI